MLSQEKNGGTHTPYLPRPAFVMALAHSTLIKIDIANDERTINPIDANTSSRTNAELT